MVSDATKTMLPGPLITDTFENQSLSLAKKSCINWKYYPVHLLEYHMEIKDFKDLILPILAQTIKPPSEMIHLKKNEIPHLSLLVKLDDEYKKAMEGYKESFQEASVIDSHMIDYTTELSQDDPITSARSGLAMVEYGPLWVKIALPPVMFVMWFLGGFLYIPIFRETCIVSYSCSKRISWMKNVKNNEVKRLNKMREQILQNYEELQAKNPEEGISYTVTVQQEKSRLESLFQEIYHEPITCDAFSLRFLFKESEYERI